jgi:membrane-associated phospholipid phosphatase
MLQKYSHIPTQAFTRRRRPNYNQGKMFITVGPDKFSFPSGHATRAITLAFFFGLLYPPFPFPSVLAFPLFMFWAVAVCASRVLLGRHHVLDVAIGAAIGFMEYLVVSLLLIGPGTAENLRQQGRNSPIYLRS